MIPDLNDLYQELILDHNRSPKNRRAIEAPDHQAEGFNPLCGDHVTVYLNVKDDRIVDASFEGSGCAISTASASLMTEAVTGKTLAEAKELFSKFHGLVTGQQSETNDDDDDGLGKLAVFSGVCQYPARVKCASLVWHTVKAALDNEEKAVTTE